MKQKIIRIILFILGGILGLLLLYKLIIIYLFPLETIAKKIYISYNTKFPVENILVFNINWEV